MSGAQLSKVSYMVPMHVAPLKLISYRGQCDITSQNTLHTWYVSIVAPHPASPRNVSPRFCSSASLRLLLLLLLCCPSSKRVSNSARFARLTAILTSLDVVRRRITFQKNSPCSRFINQSSERFPALPIAAVTSSPSIPCRPLIIKVDQTEKPVQDGRPTSVAGRQGPRVCRSSTR